jgi:ABC-type Na+ efflux pump permease subunit
MLVLLLVHGVASHPESANHLSSSSNTDKTLLIGLTVFILVHTLAWQSVKDNLGVFVTLHGSFSAIGSPTHTPTLLVLYMCLGSIAQGYICTLGVLHMYLGSITQGYICTLGNTYNFPHITL